MTTATWADAGRLDALARLDELARLDTPVHRVDARAKVVVTLAFIAVVMSFPRHVLSALTPFALFPVLVLALGRIPARTVVRKVLVALPFALAVGIFNPLFDRQPMLAVGPWLVSGGWVSFASLLARFCLTVSAALALVACTGMDRLALGLGQLGVPRAFVVQLLFFHRYLHVVADEAGRAMRAASLRADGRRALGRRAYGPLVGHLLLRSLDRAGRVHRAMLARGFDGEVRVRQPSSFGATDAVFVAAWLACFAVARAWNLAELLGRLLAGWTP